MRHNLAMIEGLGRYREQRQRLSEPEAEPQDTALHSTADGGRSDELDDSIVRGKPVIFMRTWQGIAGHFPYRWPEWIMGAAALCMSAALTLQPHMFSLAVHYDTIASWAEERTWALLVLVSGALRVFALGVNGTFETFRYSPMLRCGASFIGLNFWALFTFGFLSNAITVGLEGSSIGPVVAYGVLSVIEAMNVYRSASEVGQWVRERGQ